MKYEILRHKKKSNIRENNSKIFQKTIIDYYERISEDNSSHEQLTDDDYFPKLKKLYGSLIEGKHCCTKVIRGVQ